MTSKEALHALKINNKDNEIVMDMLEVIEKDLVWCGKMKSLLEEVIIEQKISSTKEHEVCVDYEFKTAKDFDKWVLKEMVDSVSSEAHLMTQAEREAFWEDR